MSEVIRFNKSVDEIYGDWEQSLLSNDNGRTPFDEEYNRSFSVHGTAAYTLEEPRDIEFDASLEMTYWHPTLVEGTEKHRTVEYSEDVVCIVLPNGIEHLIHETIPELDDILKTRINEAMEDYDDYESRLDLSLSGKTKSLEDLTRETRLKARLGGHNYIAFSYPPHDKPIGRSANYTINDEEVTVEKGENFSKLNSLTPLDEDFILEKLGFEHT